MIYLVNGYNEKATYFVDQATFDSTTDVKNRVNIVVGTQTDAETKLADLQKYVLEYEASRFSICATFVDGNNTTWREVQETDPEDTICQVFDTFTGSYTQVSNKTEAHALNEQKKQAFLASVDLDRVIELDAMPTWITQPVSVGTQTL